MAKEQKDLEEAVKGMSDLELMFGVVLFSNEIVRRHAAMSQSSKDDKKEAE